MKEISVKSQTLRGAFHACTTVCLRTASMFTQLNEVGVSGLISDKEYAQDFLNMAIESGIAVNDTLSIATEGHSRSHNSNFLTNAFHALRKTVGLTGRRSAERVLALTKGNESITLEAIDGTQIIPLSSQMKAIIPDSPSIHDLLNNMTPNQPVLLTDKNHTTVVVKRKVGEDKSGQTSYGYFWFDSASNAFKASLKYYREDEMLKLSRDLNKLYKGQSHVDSTAVRNTCVKAEELTVEADAERSQDEGPQAFR